jgi:lipopolysaccharide export system protein LptA
MKIRFFTILFSAAFIAVCPNSNATENNTSEQPLEITADKTLEWHRNNNKYIARGNVVVVQGSVTIAAETITADYRETKTSSFDIYNLTAEKNVAISSQEAVAKGDTATYNVDSGLAVMTGQNLIMESPEQTVRARDNFEYYVTEGKLIANGDVVVVRQEDTITADTMTANFEENISGKRELRRLDAIGNVKVITPTEVLTGTKGHYDAKTNIAKIIGNVKISRGSNVLEGESAEVNLSTNISKMFGSPAAGGRVRGVFYPENTGSDTKDAPAQVIEKPQENESSGLLTQP